MRATDIISLISDEALDFLSVQTKADYKVHKLKGSVLFKLLVYSLLTHPQTSLRVLEAVFNTYCFKTACGIAVEQHPRFNSIRDRIATIPAQYFEKLFHHCFDTYSNLLRKPHPYLIRYDSTMVAISAALLDFGIKAGEKTTKKQVKFTIGFNGLLPCSAKAFTHSKYTSENIALAEVIREACYNKNDIAVFDRGLQNRKKLCSMDEAGIYFVTRLKTDARLQTISATKVKAPKGDVLASVNIKQDTMVYLFDRSGKTPRPLRLIKATVRKTGEPIWFLTNIITLGAYQIAAIYKRRWDIEVFFRFLKQQLNFKHILVRTVNAIQVMLYVTLIVAILLLAYRQLNALKGYKLLKLRFAQELEEDLIKTIVLLCGGDPSKMYQAP